MMRVERLKCRLSIAVALAVALSSCSSKDEPVNKIETIAPIYVFPPVVTERDFSSIIDNPGEPWSGAHIIDSNEQLIELIPVEVREENPLYQNVDFKKYSIISLKYTLIYYFSDIDYTLLKSDAGLDVNQYFYVSGDVEDGVLYVMSNLLTPKLSSDLPVTIWQSFNYSGI